MLKTIRISRAEECEIHEQRAYVSRESCARRKMSSSFVVARDEGDEEEEMWVAREPSLCLFFVKGDTNGVKPAFVQHMESIMPFDERNETLECVCLRRATMDGGEDESKVGRSMKEDECTTEGN